MPLDEVGSTNDNVIFTSVMFLLNTALTDMLKTNITDSNKIITIDLKIDIYKPVISVLSDAK
jgi:hypothetical protein